MPCSTMPAKVCGGRRQWPRLRWNRRKWGSGRRLRKQQARRRLVRYSSSNGIRYKGGDCRRQDKNERCHRIAHSHETRPTLPGNHRFCRVVVELSNTVHCSLRSSKTYGDLFIQDIYRILSHCLPWVCRSANQTQRNLNVALDTV